MSIATVNTRSIKQKTATMEQNVVADFLVSNKQSNCGIEKKPGRYVEIFLIHSPLAKRDKKANCKVFFQSNLSDVDKLLVGQPVFLSRETALQHSRFMGSNHCILKAYVLDAAIEGRSSGLVLKKGFISKAHVEGCLFHDAAEMQHFKNPYFEEHYRESCYL